MIFEIHLVVLPHSISATYHVLSCITPFMIILGSAGILLICYDGYDKQDSIICTLAGIFGLCICIFPCSTYPNNIDLDPNILIGTFQLPAGISGWIHNIAAVIFFGLLAYNSFFLFTKSSGEMTPEKKKRNIKRINSQYLKLNLVFSLKHQSIINQLLCDRRRMCMLKRLHLK